MESGEINEHGATKKKNNGRGTRRQQRYRAKQKLLELCELASAHTVAATAVVVAAATEVSFDMSEEKGGLTNLM
jgi:hypothetical protein